MDFARLVLAGRLHRSFKHLVRAVLCITVVAAVGTVGYSHFENLSAFDALYFTVVTLSTIGYGDIHPTTHESRMFTIFFIPLGVSAFLYTFSAVAMTIFEGRLMEVLKLEQAKDRIKRMRNHVVLCGYGEVGEYVTKNLKDVVVIETDEGRFEELLRDGLLGVNGDSTDPEVLREAGVERAKAVIVALNEDPKVVFTILTVKEMNPQAKVYARANRRDAASKIKAAGADYVVCLPEIGGRELINAVGAP